MVNKELVALAGGMTIASFIALNLTAKQNKLVQGVAVFVAAGAAVVGIKKFVL